MTNINQILYRIHHHNSLASSFTFLVLAVVFYPKLVVSERKETTPTTTVSNYNLFIIFFLDVCSLFHFIWLIWTNIITALDISMGRRAPFCWHIFFYILLNKWHVLLSYSYNVNREWYNTKFTVSNAMIYSLLSVLPIFIMGNWQFFFVRCCRCCHFVCAHLCSES